MRRFCPLKKTAIEELGMGVNTKLHVQFSSGSGGRLEIMVKHLQILAIRRRSKSSRAQQGKSGILVDYTGGETAAAQNCLNR